MQFTRGNRKGINLYDPFFMYTVENLGIKKQTEQYISAMDFLPLKWSIIWGKPSINAMKMGKQVRLTNIKYLIAFWNDLQPYE